MSTRWWKPTYTGQGWSNLSDESEIGDGTQVSVHKHCNFSGIHFYFQ